MKGAIQVVPLVRGAIQEPHDPTGWTRTKHTTEQAMQTQILILIYVD